MLIQWKMQSDIDEEAQRRWMDGRMDGRMEGKQRQLQGRRPRCRRPVVTTQGGTPRGGGEGGAPGAHPPTPTHPTEVGMKTKKQTNKWRRQKAGRQTGSYRKEGTSPQLSDTRTQAV